MATWLDTEVHDPVFISLWHQALSSSLLQGSRPQVVSGTEGAHATNPPSRDAAAKSATAIGTLLVDQLTLLRQTGQLVAPSAFLRVDPTPLLCAIASLFDDSKKK